MSVVYTQKEKVNFILSSIFYKKSWDLLSTDSAIIALYYTSAMIALYYKSAMIALYYNSSDLLIIEAPFKMKHAMIAIKVNDISL